MALKIEGSTMVDAQRQEVWDSLFDTAILQQILNRIPGIHVDRLVQVSETKYEATASMGVAMIKGKYDGTITVLEKRIPEFVKFHGEGKGGGNFTSGDMALTLEDQGDKTMMSYAGNGNVSGALAAVGQRLIDGVGKQFVQNGTKALAEELGSRSRAKRSAASDTGQVGAQSPS